MRTYILKRIVLLLPTLFVASLLTFVLLRVVPGDTAVARAGLGATDERVAELRAELGLDRPYFPISLAADPPFVTLNSDSQYADWLGGVVRGDLGTSSTFGEPVRGEIATRLPVTVELIILSGALTVLLGVPAGILSSVKQNTPIDTGVRTIAVLGLSIPGFFLGTLMLLGAAIWWQWSPPVRYEHIWVDPVENLQLFIMPSIALAAAYAATVMRLTRSAMLDVLRNDYMRTARAKGLRGREVMVRHAVKNAMIPVATFIGLQIITMMTGAVIIEQVFNLNGVGKLLFTGIFTRDYALVQGLVLFIACVVLATNLLVDVLYGWLDPRVRYA